METKKDSQFTKKIIQESAKPLASNMPESSKHTTPSFTKISFKEQRVRAITLAYYSIPEIKKAIFDFSQNRECIPRYYEGFGKRPDAFQYEGDILEQVRRGATSFHCSEEIWSDPLEISTELSEKEFNELRTGWDLCLPDFEYIFIKEDDFVRKITIKQLAKELNLNYPGRHKIKKNLKVFSINPENYKIEYDSVKDIIIRKQKNNESIIKISVEDGKEIYVSEDHPILILTINGIKQKNAKEISNKDYLLIPLELDFPISTKYIDIIDLIQEKDYNSNYKIKYKDTDISWILVEGKNYYDQVPRTIKNTVAKGATPLNMYLNYEKNKENRKKIKLRARRSRLKIPSRIKLDYKFGKLIGYYLSEGSLDKDRIEFVFHKNEIKEGNDVINIFNNVFGIKEYNKKTIFFRKDANSLKVRVNSKLLCCLFRDLLGFKHGAHGKEIPPWVYNSPKDFITGIITGYFIGDGCCIFEWNKKSVRVDALSMSKKLIEGIAVLCIKLGINCNIIKHSNCGILRISGEEGIKKFFHYCKEFLNKKNVTLTEKKINHPSKHTLYPPYLDRDLIKMIKNRNKRINLQRAIRLGMRLNKKMTLLAANKYLRKTIKNNLFPIKVNKIEKIDYNGYLYDLETKNNNNFLQGDGIFTHNCLDVDSPYLEYSKIYTQLLIELLKFHGIENIGVKFSGSKGMHIIIPWKAFPEQVYDQKTKDMFPEWPRIICQYLSQTIQPRLAEKIFEENTLKEMAEKTGKKQEDLLITECLSCHRPSEKKELVTWKCPYCKNELVMIKKNKRIPKCPNDNCRKIMQWITSREIYSCEFCNLNSNKSPEMFAKTREKTESLIEADLILVSSRHLFRMPYSLHEKTALSSIVLDKDKINNFQITDAKPFKVKVKNFYPIPEPEEAKELLLQALDWKEQKDKQDNQYKEKSAFSQKFETTPRRNKDYKQLQIQNPPEEIFPPCIKLILRGVKQDGRKRALFLLINFFKSLGIDEQELEKRINGWNEKSYKPLKQGYIISQLVWHRKNPSRLPPNCDKPNYKDLGVCNPDELCRIIKNPVNYAVKKYFKNDILHKRKRLGIQ